MAAAGGWGREERRLRWCSEARWWPRQRPCSVARAAARVGWAGCSPVRLAGTGGCGGEPAAALGCRPGARGARATLVIAAGRRPAAGSVERVQSPWPSSSWGLRSVVRSPSPLSTTDGRILCLLLTAATVSSDCRNRSAAGLLRHLPSQRLQPPDGSAAHRPPPAAARTDPAAARPAAAPRVRPAFLQLPDGRLSARAEGHFPARRSMLVSLR